jgi:hypothetical protein
MRTHESLLLKPAQGWLVACVMASLFVLMGASGEDVFARHVGTSASAAGAPATAVDLGRPAAPSDAQPAAGVLPPGPGHGTGDGHDAAHVLHLLGACLAILCAGALFLRSRGWLPWSTRATADLAPRLVFPVSWLARVRRGPPRLTPPRFSPVIRT